MSEPLTKWLPNPNYGVGEIVYDDPNTTYDSPLTYYDGALLANVIPVSASQPTEWS